LLGHLIKAQERRHATRDTNRTVRPFEWGAEFVVEHTNGDEAHEVVRRFAREAVARSEEFYALPAIDDYKLSDGVLTWTSAVKTPSPVNNTARARFFPAQPPKRGRREEEGGARRAVVVLPQWNAQNHSHVDLSRMFARLGIAALRLSLPYHDERRPADMERADHLVSSNVGRTLQSMRQAVVDTRAAVRWLKGQGYGRVGVAGTSIGSCTAFLAFVHDEEIDCGVFNHVSGYVADVVWRGISTRHVREGFGDAVTIDEVREAWMPISPLAHAHRLRHIRPRPMRFIAARHDLTFPADLSQQVIEEVRRHGVPLDVQWLPCGHYTSGERPWVYLDGWKIVTFIRRHL